MPRSLLSGLAVAALGLPALAQTTWTVDDDGPADFSDLQVAVDTAADGDVLLVRSGSYSRVAIQGKGLSIQAQGDVGVASVPLFIPGPTLSVTGLSAGQAVHLRGLNVLALGGGEQETAVVAGCAGAVLLEDCSISGVGEPLIVTDAASLTLVRCSLVAPPTFASTLFGSFLAHVPYIGMLATGSNVFLYDTVVQGSNGPDSQIVPFPGTVLPPAPAGRGIVLGSSTLLASGCTIQGGDGGSDAEPLCLPGEDGAVGLSAGGSTVWLLDSQIEGGTGGQGGCGQPAGVDAAAVVSPGGDVLDLPGPARSFTSASPVQGGAAVPITLAGAPGDAVILHASPSAAPGLFLESFAIALHMALPLGTIPLGVVPPSGELAVLLPTPPLPAGAGAVRFVGQALFVGASGFFDGGPSTLLILDPTL